MSTWISRGAALLLLAGLGFAVPGAGAETVLDGTVRIVPPRGYCIDAKASREAADTAVMILGRCTETSAEVPALITVSVGAPGSSKVLKAGAQALADYFTSPGGRAALARDGRAASVRVRSVTVAGGALVLRLEDRKAGAYWRAMIGVKGRLVSVAVAPPLGGDLDEAAGRRILDKMVKGMRG